MIALLLLLLAQPGECNDRSPGLSKCVEYEKKGDKVACRAACYWGKRPDGGTYGRNVFGEAPTEALCKAELERQAANGCQP